MLELLPDCHGDFIGELNWHSVSDHFITVVDVVIEKPERIWKALHPCNLPDAHTPVECFIAGDEAAVVRTYFDHLWRLWMELALSTGRLHRKCLFIPAFDAVAAHKDSGKCTGKVLVVVDGGGVVMIFVAGGNDRILQIPDHIPKRKLFGIVCGTALWKDKVHAQVLAEADVENALTFFCYTIVLCIYKRDRNIIAGRFKKRNNVVDCLSVPPGEHAGDVFSKEKFGLNLPQDANIVVKQLPTRVFNAAQCARFRPGLAGRSADDSVNIGRKVFCPEAADVRLKQRCARMICAEGSPDSFVVFVGDRNIKACAFKAKVQTAAT